MTRLFIKSILTLLFLPLFFTALSLGTSLATTENPKSAKHKEYEVKTAFIYNFTKFIEWPEFSFTDSDPDYVVCILGKDNFGKALDLLSNKISGGKSFKVIHVPDLTDWSSTIVESCDILYISPSEEKDLPRIFSLLKDSSTLTISDIDGFAKQGGVIGFVNKDNRIGLQVNIEAAETMQLRISSKLLKLVEIVRE